jgi:subtilisin family serine protease
MVHLKSPGVAKLGRRSGSEQTMHRETLKAEQQAFAGQLARIAPSARVLTRVQMVANAVFIEADAKDVRKLAADANVTRVSRVVDYKMDLSETVPYIGAKAVQNLGYDGKGVRVAVLDSGIDYTHAALGGAGTLAAYAAAWGSDVMDPLNTTRDGLFPTAKVVEGYDFVGELWPFADLAPDPDPIDLEGHGTHVADIIGGAQGVAPGVSLYAVKVCSAVSSSCSGIALIQGMEYVVDPNGDGDASDRVDIVNMSLGSNYGQAFDDDLALAVNNATAVGVMTVASAGNGSDKPYISGTPAAAISALSVAQTAVFGADSHGSQGSGVHRGPLQRRVPAVVRAAHLADRGGAAVRQWCGWQPERLCGVRGRVARQQGRADRPRRVHLQREDQERRRRRRPGRHHRPHRPGRPVRGRFRR